MNDLMINTQPIVNIVLPAKHMEIRLVRAPETFLLGSRGSFKTTRGIGLYAIDMIYEMPRSTGVGVGLSYEHLDKNTMDPLLKGWADCGFYAEEHYVINKKPPEGWPRPYDFNGNEKYDRTISWHNGTVIKFLSLARKAASNAISAQWGFFDETKFMDPEDLKEVFPIFRGNDTHFKHLSSYLSKFFATDKLADPGQIEWLLKKRKLVDENKVQDIMTVQLHLNSLKGLYNRTKNDKEKERLKLEIFELEKILNEERRNMVYVAEINCYDVLPFLGEAWLQSAKRNCKSTRVWDVAYENKDPDKPAESFYPSLDDNIHTYDTEGYEDININLPFNIAIDYQHTVAPIPVSQIGTLPGQTVKSLNYVDYVYSLYPEGLRDAVRKFCDRYSHHARKRVNYIYDHTAIGKRTDADEYYIIVKDELKKCGWSVVDVYTGQAPGHFQKYNDTKDWMEEKDPKDLPIRLHRTRCEKLIKSIKGAPAKTSAGKTEKDKRYENTTKYPDLDQSETTHASDAFDMTNDAVIKHKLIKSTEQSIPLAFR
jgi:hypothetical protein